MIIFHIHREKFLSNFSQNKILVLFFIIFAFITFITMSKLTIDINNLWGEGDDELSSDDATSSSSPTHSVDNNSASTFNTTNTVSKLECPCDNLKELSTFVSTPNTTFYDQHRLKKPALLTGYVDHWNISTQHSSDMNFALQNVMVKINMEDNNVAVLYAKDDIHFFGNGLCTAGELRFDQVLSDNVMSGEHESRPFYCRMRPLPDTICPLLNIHFDDNDETVLFKQKLCACWIGCAGTITPLHFDTCHGFLAVVKGTKKVTLFPPEDTMYMYRDRRASSMNPNSSVCDYELWRVAECTEKVDRGCPRHPPIDSSTTSYRAMYSRMEETTPQEVLVHGGTMLYIPPGWWHTVENVTATISVLLPFDMVGDEDLHPALHYL